MIENREEEWAQLEARAFRLLEHAKEVEPREGIRRYGSLLRLWHYPAFEPQRTWTILTPGRKATPGTPPLAREVTWDRSADHQRMFGPPLGIEQGFGTQPSIRLREGVLPESGLHRLLEAGAHLTVPIINSGNQVGLEGEYFGLETYTVSPNVRVQWWCDGPTEWRHFTDWVGGLRSFLLSCLDPTG